MLCKWHTVPASSSTFLYLNFQRLNKLTLLTNCPQSVIRSLENSETANSNNPSNQCGSSGTAAFWVLFACSYIITCLWHSLSLSLSLSLTHTQSHTHTHTDTHTHTHTPRKHQSWLSVSLLLFHLYFWKILYLALVYQKMKIVSSFARPRVVWNPVWLSFFCKTQTEKV